MIEGLIVGVNADMVCIDIQYKRIKERIMKRMKQLINLAVPVFAVMIASSGCTQLSPLGSRLGISPEYIKGSEAIAILQDKLLPVVALKLQTMNELQNAGAATSAYSWTQTDLLVAFLPGLFTEISADKLYDRGKVESCGDRLVLAGFLVSNYTIGAMAACGGLEPYEPIKMGGKDKEDK